jgi:hypothetical protein
MLGLPFTGGIMHKPLIPSLLFLDGIEFAPEPPPDDADIAWPGASDDEE